MAANFPKLPGFVPTHDPTLVDHKKISHIKLEKIRNAKNVEVPLHALPRQVEKIFLPEKADLSKSFSHMQYPNHQGTNLNELFEPTFVKLDKQVSHSFPFIFDCAPRATHARPVPNRWTARSHFQICWRQRRSWIGAVFRTRHIGVAATRERLQLPRLPCWIRLL